MKKTYIVLILLITVAFLTACTNKSGDDAALKTCIQEKDLPTICTSYCTQASVPAEPEAPPVIVPPNVLPDKTTFSNPIPNVGNAVIDREKNTITIKFQNNKNATILLPLTGSASKYSKSECKNPQITATYKGNPVQLLVTEIENGDEFTVTWDCENLAEVPAIGTLFSADLVFNYKVETGMIYSEMGTVVGKY
jgi:hypothetical protein